jgi:amino acid permease
MKLPKITKSILALFTLVGTTIGVGFYALPFAYSKFPLISFAVLGLALTIMNILYHLYIRIITDKRIGNHQLPGITERILSKKLKNVVAVPLLLSRSGVLFLYITIFGNFTKAIFKNTADVTINPLIPAIAITILISLLIRKKLKNIGKVNLYLSLTLIVLVVIISFRGIFENIGSNPLDITKLFSDEIGSIFSTPLGSMRELGLIYGVSIVSLSGIAAIPSLELIIEDRDKLKTISFVGSLLTASLYTIFIVFIFSSSGPITEDALSGFTNSVYIIPLLIAGLLSTITSFIGVGRSLFEIYTFDYEIPDIWGWFLTIFVPLLMYIFTNGSFARIVGIIGGLIGGIEGILIIANYVKLMNMNKKIGKIKLISLILLSMFLLMGIIFTL